jgi:hypothetical protein
MYNTKNFTEQGGDVTHIGGKLVFDEGAEGIMPNQAATTGTSGTDAIAAFNSLLVKLKNAGLMTADEWSAPTVTKNINDTVAGHANRQANTNDISSVAVADGVITITLSKKVSALKDFDGGNGWGVHKWLGIGVRPWTKAITDLYYNGAKLTAEDVAEAQSVGLDETGYFVRWVAADLVLAGDNSQKSKNTFTLWADGYQKATYQLKIVEPAT